MFFFWFTVVSTAILILPGALMLPMAHRIYRRNRDHLPYVNAYRLLIFYTAYVLIRGVVLVAWPHQPSQTVAFLSSLPVLLVCGGFAAFRVYRDPEILFSELTIARVRAIRDRMRRPGR